MYILKINNTLYQFLLREKVCDDGENKGDYGESKANVRNDLQGNLRAGELGRNILEEGEEKV